jgi:hypothetical protein
MSEEQIEARFTLALLVQVMPTASHIKTMGDRLDKKGSYEFTDSHGISHILMESKE